MKYFAKFLALFLALVLSLALPSAAFAGDGNGKVKPEKSQSQAATVPDDNDDNKHPSGKDKETNNGPTDDTQGNSPSDPDDDGKGPDRSNGGADKPGGPGGNDRDDQDGNNGCGNDDDFEDDNEGLCGGKPKPEKSDKPTPKPEPAKSAQPTKGPESPKPSKAPAPVSKECPSGTAVGEFSNNSGNAATLTVTVNGEVSRFGLTVTEPSELSGVFPVHPTDFSFPGVVHISGLEPGDSISLSITDGQTTDSDSGVVSENCAVGVNVTLAESVAPVAPPVKPVSPVEAPKAPVVTTPETVVLPNKMGPAVPVQVPTQQVSDGHTVTIGEELPYTGVSAMLMFYIGIMLLGLGVLCYTLPVAFDTRRLA